MSYPPALRVYRPHTVDNPLDIEFRAQYFVDGRTPDLGRLVVTPAYYLHTLEVSDGCEERRRVVEAMTTFAHGFALHARDHALPGSFAPSEILFHVAPDNAKMRAYVESKGARAEAAILYRLPL